MRPLDNDVEDAGSAKADGRYALNLRVGALRAVAVRPVRGRAVQVVVTVGEAASAFAAKVEVQAARIRLQTGILERSFQAARVALQ